jgi:hypothetical protein
VCLKKIWNVGEKVYKETFHYADQFMWALGCEEWSAIVDNATKESMSPLTLGICPHWTFQTQIETLGRAMDTTSKRNSSHQDEMCMEIHKPIS